MRAFGSDGCDIPEHFAKLQRRAGELQGAGAGRARAQGDDPLGVSGRARTTVACCRPGSGDGRITVKPRARGRSGAVPVSSQRRTAIITRREALFIVHSTLRPGRPRHPKSGRPARNGSISVRNSRRPPDAASKCTRHQPAPFYNSHTSNRHMMQHSI
jgi:hypothetical protein